MTKYRKIALAMLAAPLALGVASCGSSADNEALAGEPIDPIVAPEGAQWTETVNISEMDGYVLGNPDAPIKLVEYGSLTCGTCANFAASASEKIKSEYVSSGRVSYELRNQIHNGIDLVLARLVRCGQKESFHPLSDQVWFNLNNVLTRAQANPQALDGAMNLPENQRFVAVGEATGLLDFFAARGLSRDQASICLADAASVSAIADRSNTQSAELGVTGTPTFFINDRKVDGNSWGDIEPLLQQAGAR